MSQWPHLIITGGYFLINLVNIPVTDLSTSVLSCHELMEQEPLERELSGSKDHCSLPK